MGFLNGMKKAAGSVSKEMSNKAQLVDHYRSLYQSCSTEELLRNYKTAGDPTKRAAIREILRDRGVNA